jgi:hypothetical protein
MIYLLQFMVQLYKTTYIILEQLIDDVTIFI